MRQLPREFDQRLAAAIGEEPVLALDLAAAFQAGAAGHRVALGRAADVAAWQDAAARLQGLAASFGALGLMRAASRAADRPARDEQALAEIDAELARIA